MVWTTLVAAATNVPAPSRRISSARLHHHGAGAGCIAPAELASWQLTVRSPAQARRLHSDTRR